jgi:hypothetical protein
MQGSSARALLPRPCAGDTSEHDRVRAALASSLLRGTLEAHSALDEHLFASYARRLTYVLASLPDARFDVLAPDGSLYADRRPALQLTFWPKSFTLSLTHAPGQRHPTFDFAYDASLADVLECFETGLISPSLLRLIEKMRFAEWERGEVVAHVLDCRYTRQREFHLRLALGGEALRYLRRRAFPAGAGRDALEFERQALLMLYPEICVDPSPAVARMASLLDWRHRMWAPNARRRPRAAGRAPAAHAPIVTAGPRFDYPGYEGFELPEKLKRLFKEASERNEKASAL